MADLRLGIVGLPNVGKSTLFNALTAAGAAADNYPFCTVEPNVGVVVVPDDRLDRLFERLRPPARVPATVSFVDIAGLVRGASEGEGLGNRFLANIRDVHAIVHVIRCFEDPDVAHVLGDVDPVRDRDIVRLELALADLQLVERRIEKCEKLARSGDADARRELDVLQRLASGLGAGRPARDIPPEPGEDDRTLHELDLLTARRELCVANIGESDIAAADLPHVRALERVVAEEAGDAEVLLLSVRIEAELAELQPAERNLFLADLGLERPGLDRLIRTGYRLLDLISFYTTNDKEVRAWTVRRGTRAPEAAGRIHTDFERGFIRAETLAWDDFLRAGSLKTAREHGWIRSEGRDYEVRDGDIILFRFNV